MIFNSFSNCSTTLVGIVVAVTPARAIENLPAQPFSRRGAVRQLLRGVTIADFVESKVAALGNLNCALDRRRIIAEKSRESMGRFQSVFGVGL